MRMKLQKSAEPGRDSVDVRMPAWLALVMWIALLLTVLIIVLARGSA